MNFDDYSYKSTTTPIFLLSTARSGTTAFSNHLCQHPKIAGLLANEHWGIHECRFISAWQYYFGDLKKDENFFFFVESFCDSDVFQMAELNKEIFYKYRPRDFYDVFTIIINEYAKKKSAVYWLNNDPKQAFYTKDLVNNFPEAYYIILRRNIVETVRSNVKRFAEKSTIGLAQKVFRFQTDFKAIDREMTALLRVKDINFSDFIHHKEDVLRDAISFLNLDWDSCVLENPYKVQSSFNVPDKKENFFGTKERLLVNLFNVMFMCLPFSVIKRPVRKIWDKRSVENLIVPPFFYRLHENADLFEGTKFHREDGGY